MRDQILKNVLDSVPRAFLEGFAKRAQDAYVGVYEEVKADTRVLGPQRLFKLKSVRQHRLDFEMMEAAQAAGMVGTERPLPYNDWCHAYAVSGTFGLTQSYVPAIGEKPQSAKFRDALASAANVPRMPLDDDEEIYKPRTYYGLLAHNPVGKRFTDEHQKLGSLNLCVPYPEMSGWAFEMNVWELIGLYPAEQRKPTSQRAPILKRRPAKKKEGEK
ncbi:hypothetical protein [Parvularcula oceani]|uniref:hypothetical protein n=1 Tax=Parvularcula oceani TaxID=1247963 RepID=UPI0012DF5A12|nr:hypothetical protein [Parvularcula oceani]